jgi:hypothetical protein
MRTTQNGVSEIKLKHISGRTKDQEPGCSAVFQNGVLYVSPAGNEAIYIAMKAIDVLTTPLDRAIAVLSKMGIKDPALTRCYDRGFHITVDDDIVDYAG